jgi:hypothetical protein
MEEQFRETVLIFVLEVIHPFIVSVPGGKDITRPCAGA